MNSHPSYRLRGQTLFPAPSWLPATVAQANRRLGPGRRSLRQRIRLAFERIRWEIGNRSTAIDRFVAYASVLGMTASVLCDLPVRTAAFAGSDMKTLFASAWCFAHGLDAYTLGNIRSVFAANRVVFPDNWFGHSPVYPPMTLTVLAPLTLVGMVPAVYGMAILSALLFAAALAALSRYAAESGCPFRGRVALAVLCASCPLFAFALSVGNVSVAASALAILSFVRRSCGGTWRYGWLLATAVILKPHLGLWMLTGMLLLPERASRAVAGRAILIAGGFTSLVFAALAAAKVLQLQASGLIAVLRLETSSGSSMNPGSKEVLPIYAQILSLHSLLGFWWRDCAVQTILLLFVLMALGLAATWRLRSARGEDESVIAIGAWVAFGLLATYHRAHDAVLLLLILAPWLMRNLIETPRRWYLWTVMACLLAMNFSVPLAGLEAEVVARGYNSVVTFFLMRQAALADFVVALALLLASVEARHRHSRRFSPTREAVFVS